VLVHYGNSDKEADAVVAEIRNAGGRAEKVGADLRQADGPHILAKRVRAIVGDRLDILVANAGISKTASIEDTQIEDFDNLFAVNVRAPFFPGAAVAAGVMQGQQHHLHVFARCPCFGRRAVRLCRDQGAVDTLVKHLASALGPRGIRVNAVAPGVVETDMSSFAKTARVAK